MKKTRLSKGIFLGIALGLLTIAKVSHPITANAEVQVTQETARTRTINVYDQEGLEKALARKDLKTVVINTQYTTRSFVMPDGYDYEQLNLVVNTKSIVILPQGANFYNIKVKDGASAPILFDDARDHQLVAYYYPGTYKFNTILTKAQIAERRKIIEALNKKTVTVYNQEGLTKALKNKNAQRIILKTVKENTVFVLPSTKELGTKKIVINTNAIVLANGNISDFTLNKSFFGIMDLTTSIKKKLVVKDAKGNYILNKKLSASESDLLKKMIVAGLPDIDTTQAKLEQALKDAGMIYMPDYLDELLANGEITKEDYDWYYPTNGMGWFIGKIDADIDANIEGIVSNYTGWSRKYFYIKFVGVSESGKYLEFKCYDA